jgi:hypothetical protein
MASDPIGMRNISTTYQEAYETLDGNAQVRKIGKRLWEVLARGGAAIYAKTKPEALAEGFELAARVSRRAATRGTPRQSSATRKKGSRR